MVDFLTIFNPLICANAALPLLTAADVGATAYSTDEIAKNGTGCRVRWSGTAWRRDEDGGLLGSYPYGPWFGDGTDGPIVLDGVAAISGMSRSGSVYTLSKNFFADSLTVNSGVTLRTANYQLFCRKTLTNSGNVNNDGNNATGQTAGAAIPAAYLGVSQAGASGVAGAANGAASAGVSAGGGIGGSAGVGGVSGAGNNAGTPGGFNFGLGGSFQILSNPSIWALGKVFSAANAVTGLIAGASGTSGGAAASSTSGGGGGGGGILPIAAPIITGTGTFSSRGGNGGNASGAAAGGGGAGGGGLIWIVTVQQLGPGLSFVLSGGTPGTGVGTGVAGTSGGTGRQINIFV